MKPLLRTCVAMAAVIVAGRLSAASGGSQSLGADGSNNQTQLAADNAKPVHEFTGVVYTGIVAIGGETTGVIFETKSGKYELDVKGDKDMAAKLEALNGKRATIIGDYEKREGVELKTRHIIVVREVHAAPEAN